MSLYVAPAGLAGQQVSVGADATTRSTRGGRAATWLLVASILLAALVAGGAALGYRGAVELTGSMQPAIAPGDLLVDRRMPASDIRPGQIISFSRHDDPSITITHRVRSVQPAGNGQLTVVTRGDANNTTERWSTSPSATVGHVITVIPKLGLLTRWSSDPVSRFAVFAILGLLLLGLGLRWVWRSDDA